MPNQNRQFYVQLRQQGANISAANPTQTKKTRMNITGMFHACHASRLHQTQLSLDNRQIFEQHCGFCNFLQVHVCDFVPSISRGFSLGQSDWQTVKPGCIKRIPAVQVPFFLFFIRRTRLLSRCRQLKLEFYGHGQKLVRVDI